MTVSNTFCVLPWMHLATTSTGNMRVCCNSTPGKNLIKKDDGTVYKVFKDNIQEAWNSETYHTIRQQMLNGERPEMCQRCFREEDAGLVSTRTNLNIKWQEDKEYTVDAPFDIKYADIRLGNLCNLKCRMCNPYSSNQWLKEWSLVETALSEEEYKRLDTMGWPENEKTWDNLFSIVPTIKEIYLTGGEPTIIKEQYKLLNYCIDNGYSKKIKLKYNTNLTNIPRDLIETWKQFKQIQLNCSIDAVGDLDRYIRYPSNWPKIQENFDLLQDLDNSYIEIHNTVQMYNILRLDDFLDWALPYGHKIYFNILNHPEYLNIRVLPPHLKLLAKDKLEQYTDVPKVQGIIDYMMSEDWSNKFDSFKEYTFALDKSRNENLFDLIPEFE
jgi:MoaA/NifB/PqqE/SkfB family radical SAM enzyme